MHLCWRVTPNCRRRRNAETCFHSRYGIIPVVRNLVLVLAALVCWSVRASAAEAESPSVPAYLGTGAGLFLPGGGSTLSRAAQVAVRAGWYMDDFIAWEIEGACAPNASSRAGHAAVTGLAARGLFHFAGWEAFDKLFGCERFDPFLTAGVQTYLSSRAAFADGSHRTGVGPSVGLGAFYYLTDAWAVRADATATLAIGSPCGMDYGLLIGVQYSFGGESGL